MKNPAFFIVLALALILANGCSLSPAKLNPTTGGGGGGTVTPVAGNFSFAGTSQVTTTVFAIGGTLNISSSGALTATMHVSGSSCFNPQTDQVAFTGTVTSAGALTATSAAVNGQVIKLTATLTGTTVSAGTFTITGGCATGEHGTLAGFLMTAMTASYTGNLTSGSTVITISSSPLVQSTTADSQGFFHLTGSLTFSSSSCGLSGAIIGSSSVAGTTVVLTLNGSDGLSSISFTGAATDATAKTINGQFSIGGTGVCSGVSGTGMLTHS